MGIGFSRLPLPRGEQHMKYIRELGEELKHLTYVERNDFHNVLRLNLNVAITFWEDDMHKNQSWSADNQKRLTIYRLIGGHGGPVLVPPAGSAFYFLYLMCYEHKTFINNLPNIWLVINTQCFRNDSALSLFLVISANEEQKAPGFLGALRVPCLLPKDLLDAFSVTNRTLRELLLSELQKSSLIRHLIDRRNSRAPSMLRLSLQRRTVDNLETVNDIMNESWAPHLVRGLFLHPAAGARVLFLGHSTEFNLTCSTLGHIQRWGIDELIHLHVRAIKKIKDI